VPGAARWAAGLPERLRRTARRAPLQSLLGGASGPFTRPCARSPSCAACGAGRCRPRLAGGGGGEGCSFSESGRQLAPCCRCCSSPLVLSRSRCCCSRRPPAAGMPAAPLPRCCRAAVVALLLPCCRLPPSPDRAFFLPAQVSGAERSVAQLPVHGHGERPRSAVEGSVSGWRGESRSKART
jgi:hypothetical protein